MKHNRAKLIVILLMGLGLTRVQAQEAVPATGGNASGSGGSASYSVGQVVYTTNSGTSGSVASGVQHSYDISIISGLEESSHVNLAAYPNPTTDFLNLTVENFKENELSYQLFDMTGKRLHNKPIDNKEMTIPMADLQSATYYLIVISHERRIKTFRIIKN